MLTKVEAARVLRRSVRTLERVIERGGIAVVKEYVGGNSSVLVPRSEILRWMIERSHST